MTHRSIQALALPVITALLLLASVVTPAAFAQPAVQVKVTEQVSGSQTLYSYRIVNNSTQPVVAVHIGFDYLHGVAELPVAPTGWTFDGGLPATSAMAPTGWQALVVTTEESPFFEVHWSNEGAPSGDVAPGTSRAGFRVLLPRAVPAYATAHFDVILGDSTHVSELIVPDDAPPPVEDETPPTLSVTLTPDQLWSPDHTMASIQAFVTADDDQDPNPVVRLVSITCNEPIDPAVDITGAGYGTDDRQFSVRAERAGQNKLGRIYTVTYSATDAAGNTATATATVTVPHDLRH